MSQTVDTGLEEATINANIELLMVRRGLSQADLAAVLDLSQGVVSERLRGKTPWRLPELVRAAALLGATLAQLSGSPADLPWGVAVPALAPPSRTRRGPGGRNKGASGRKRDGINNGRRYVPAGHKGAQTGQVVTPPPRRSSFLKAA